MSTTSAPVRPRGRPSAEELRELCTAAVRRLQSEEGFREWVEAMRSLHRYSPWNALWLIAQRPDVTYVASYRRWQRLGYQVRGGEPGLMVWVPIRRRPKRADEEEDEREERLAGFRVGRVFDRSQVDPIPGQARALDPPPREELAGDSHEAAITGLERFARRLGFEVRREELAQAWAATAIASAR